MRFSGCLFIQALLEIQYSIFFFIMVNSFFIFNFFYISKKICQAGFTMRVEVLWAELRSCLQYATSSSTAPLGVPQLGLEHVRGGT